MLLCDLHNLFEYNDWANDVLIDMLAAAFEEDTYLRASDPPMVLEIQETAVHIIGALQIWRLRWLATSATAMMDPAPHATPRLLREAFHKERDELWRYFSTLESDDRLDEIIAYSNTRGESFEQPLAAMMQHVVNHSSYHRGQITALLMALGHDEVIESTDFSTWTVIGGGRR